MPLFGEGFYVTETFLLIFFMIALYAFYTESKIAETVMIGMLSLLGIILKGWFDTRGKTHDNSESGCTTN